MKTLEKFRVVLIIVVLLIIISSCSSDETSNNGNIMLKATSTFNNFANKNEDSKSESVIDISSFKVNIKDIKFEIDDHDDDENDDDENDDDENNENENEDLEFELEGPFELDLSNGESNIVNVEIPDNVYEEIKFNLHKSTDIESEMYGKSIEIKGEINGFPFVFWHDTEEQFEVDFDDSNIDLIVNGNSIILTINFDLNAVFGIYSSIDFSNLIDDDANGIIEINPNNDDGNKELADFIINLLEEESELDDD